MHMTEWCHLLPLHVTIGSYALENVGAYNGRSFGLIPGH